MAPRSGGCPPVSALCCPSVPPLRQGLREADVGRLCWLIFYVLSQRPLSRPTGLKPSLTKPSPRTRGPSAPSLSLLQPLLQSLPQPPRTSLKLSKCHMSSCPKPASVPRPLASAGNKARRSNPRLHLAAPPSRSHKHLSDAVTTPRTWPAPVPLWIASSGPTGPTLCWVLTHALQTR